jgi:hypothetical protein
VVRPRRVSQPPPKARISAMAVVKRLAWTCSAATRLLNSTAQALELSNRVAALQVQASRFTTAIALIRALGGPGTR